MVLAAASVAVLQNGSAATVPVADGIVAAVFGLAALLTLVSLLVPLARRLGQPFTVMIAALGAALGFLTLLDANGAYSGMLLQSLARLDVSANAFLYVFLPPLLFAGGLTVDVRRLMDDIGPVVLLAVVAVFMCTFAVGLSLWLASGEAFGATLLTCLLLGAIVATTDTAAVLGIFRDIGAPGRLTTIVEGESLFNDAAAIALMFVLLAMMTQAGQSVGLSAGLYSFAYGLVGGIFWGYLIARIYCWIIGQFRTGIVSEITLSVSLAYLTFVTAQEANLLGVSGIIAVVVAAMTFASMGRTKLSPGAWDTLLVTWRQLEFWATSLIFVLAAMKAPKMIAEGVTWAHAAGVAAVFVGALIARAAVLWGMLPLLTLAGLGQAISNSYKIVLCWGSLRGAVTVALALLVAETPGVPDEAKSFIFIIAMGYVFTTLFLSAPTLRPLMKALKLDKLSPQERMVRNRVMALSRGRVRDQLVKVSEALGLSGNAPVAAADDAEDVLSQMSHADLARAGLIIAANREAEMSLEYLRQGVVGSRIAERLRSDAGAVLDGLKSGGPERYIRAALRLQRPSRSFRVALWLQRRFGWTGPLADEMADRFELLIVKNLMLDELTAFAKDKLAGLIGNVALVEVLEALNSRREAVQSAMAALDLQYSEYTQSMRRRFRDRLAVSLEEAEYQSQLDQNLISNEVYEDLEEDRRRRKTAMERRPPLDLGLELAEMLIKVPMFAGLDKPQLGRLAQLLNTELAVPGEHVIRVGETGDRMFFIGSGALEVQVGGRAVRKLERGDFVGEMALLTNQPRNADVIALGYTNVMALKRRDFDVFLREHPQLKAKIEAEAAERLAQNLKAATH